MKKFLSCVFCSVSMLTFSNGLLAYTAGELADDCQAQIDINEEPLKHADSLTHYKAGRCIGYVSGVGEAYVTYGAKFSNLGDAVDSIKQASVYCVPLDIDPKQLIDIIVDAIEEVPGVKKEPADSVLIELLVDKFPCPKPEKKDISNIPLKTGGEALPAH